jgi:hypothetical protein
MFACKAYVNLNAPFYPACAKSSSIPRQPGSTRQAVKRWQPLLARALLGWQPMDHSLINAHPNIALSYSPPEDTLPHSLPRP